MKSGVANARAKGVRVGRPEVRREDVPPVFYKYYPQYRLGQMTLSELAKVCGRTRQTMYNWLKIVEGRA